MTKRAGEHGGRGCSLPSLDFFPAKAHFEAVQSSLPFQLPPVGARGTSALVSASPLVTFRPMIPASKKTKSVQGAPRCAPDLFMPPPEPLRPRGTHLPPTVPEIIQRLGPVCRQHGITRLEIFGSVARGEATQGSDVDLIATFSEHPGLEIVSIEEECARLLDVPVDLLTFEAVEEITNRFRRETIERDRRVIYAG